MTHSIDYITPMIAGRLGNQMFEIANVYSLALQYNKEWYVHRKALICDGHNYADSILSKVPLIDDFVDNRNHNRKPPSNNKHTIYTGHYQSERYFVNIKDKVRELFACPNEVKERLKNELNIIPNTTCIQVRRGDYLKHPNYHPVISSEYIYYCVSRLDPASHYLIFSDDIEWCRQNINLPNITFVENYSPAEQIWAMSLCTNFVISNSSFGWWGAYLANYSKVLCPSVWFGQDGPSPKDYQEIYCSDWTIIDTTNVNGVLYITT